MANGRQRHAELHGHRRRELAVGRTGERSGARATWRRRSNTAGLAAGTYNATVTITAAGAPRLAAGDPRDADRRTARRRPARRRERDRHEHVVRARRRGEAYRLDRDDDRHRRRSCACTSTATSAATRLDARPVRRRGGTPTSLLGSGTITTVTAGAWNEVTLADAGVRDGRHDVLVRPPQPHRERRHLRWRDHAGGTGGAEKTSAGRTLSALPGHVGDARELHRRPRVRHAVGRRRRAALAGARGVAGRRSRSASRPAPPTRPRKTVTVTNTRRRDAELQRLRRRAVAVGVAGERHRAARPQRCPSTRAASRPGPTPAP